MNRIWVVVLMFVLPLIFTLKVSGQVVSDSPSGAEIKKLSDTAPLEKMDKYGVPVKEPKFSASMGIGPGYNYGEEHYGKLKNFSNVSSYSLKFGYLPNKYLEIQGEYSNTSKFKSVTNVGNTTRSYSAFIVSLKAGIPLRIKEINFYPYVIIGAGRAKTKYHLDYSGIITFTHDLTSYDKCWKTGIGVETKIHKNVYVFSELNTWKMKWRWDVNNNTNFYSQALFGLSVKI